MCDTLREVTQIIYIHTRMFYHLDILHLNSWFDGARDQVLQVNSVVSVDRFQEGYTLLIDHISTHEETESFSFVNLLPTCLYLIYREFNLHLIPL
jgi:hypothetical protein